MTLAELVEAISQKKIVGSIEARIAGLRHDSRDVEPGDVFFALAGAKTDGNRHVREALSKGAIAIVSEMAAPAPPMLSTGTWIEVPDIAEAMGACADKFFQSPSKSMTVIGVTGTNGKTTTTYFLESIVNAAGGTPAVAGTIEYRVGSRRLSKAVNTTPISLEMIRLLARFRDAKATHALLEISSHALALKRVETIDFDAAIFLNLFRDHLDFHHTPEAYFEAKAHLFDLLSRPDNSKKLRVAALNADDPRSQSLRNRAPGCEIVMWGLGPKAADMQAKIIEAGLDGTRAEFNWRGKKFPISLRLPGRHIVMNSLAAAAAALGLGMPIDKVAQGLAAVKAVPGRLEPVDSGQNFHVFVDYAHTDSALETVLTLLAGLPHERILTVFGCGGDRDKTKRGPMGVAACRGSAKVYLTSDNPRSEEPAAIVGDIEAGIRAAGLKNYTIILDRAEAISAAISEASAGDVVLIAGKGHEDYQILKDRTISFDDRQSARQALRRLKGAQ